MYVVSKRLLPHLPDVQVDKVFFLLLRPMGWGQDWKQPGGSEPTAQGPKFLPIPQKGHTHKGS